MAGARGVGKHGFVQQHGLLTAEQQEAGRRTAALVEEHGLRTVRIIWVDQHGAARCKFNTVFACNQVQSGFNWSHYCNSDVDSKIVAANATVDRNQRTKAYEDVVTTLNQAGAFLPIYDTKTILVTKGVSGIQFGPTGQPYYTAASR